MIRFIENIGNYFSQHFFNEDFPKNVFDKSGYVTQKRDDDGQQMDNHVSTINSKVAPLREKYFRFKNEYLSIQRIEDRVKLTHDFHNELLETLDYKNGIQEYESPVYLNNHEEVIPVRYQYFKGDKPYLFIMEMKSMIKEGDDEPEGIYEQVYLKEEWEKVFPEGWNDIQIKPDIINEALTELFILSEDERPEYLIMLAAPKIFLIHYEKWKYDSFLLFDLEELFTESKVPANRDYLSLFYALLSKPQFISDTDSILHVLEEDAHKSMYGVTQALKNSVVFAVESLANEAIYYKLKKAGNYEGKQRIEELMANDTFARELKDECLTFVYRLLFLFYAESREDLEILPVRDTVYQKGYSLEMLRDLEMVPLTTDSSRHGHFFSESLWKLFNYLHKGQENENGFTMKPLDSPLFDNSELVHLHEVQFRNYILQEIILRLSLSERTRKKGRGRISYANLGINQLGSVYESLLAYSGFFASETLIEVKAASDKDGKEGTFLVPKKRRDDFEEDEILKDSEYHERDTEIEKGSFVYRLNGRDRKKTASYYTPEVLTQTTVKYTLKGILDKLNEKQKNEEDCADEILQLKVLEPAMGAAAFQNEVINQLAVAYLELKENEVVKRGGKRIIPGEYKDELQKVKAYIASHNVYGVDLNPTAIELGKLSLWLNCMHKDMETPFFAHRLGVGNAVVGAWLKVYNPKDFIVEFPKEGTIKQRKTPIPKDWWNKSPERVTWKKGKLIRKADQIYHFLLPDESIVPSAGIKMLKDELSDAELRTYNAWKKDLKTPIRGDEHIRLKRICAVIDVLLEEHYQQTIKINSETTSHYNLYGQAEPALDFKNYREKERLAKLRDDRSAPYFKLKTIMDYWCGLWFWDVRKVKELPTREQWYNEVESILGLDIAKLKESGSSSMQKTGFEDPRSEQTELFGTTKQMSIGSPRPKPYDQNQQIKQLIADYSSDISSFYQQGRIHYIQQLSVKYRFFHNELEFIEVYNNNAGFDIITGNPPWIKIVLETKDILSEFDPKLVISETSAAGINTKELLSKKEVYHLLVEESIEIISLSNFFGGIQNYKQLAHQQADLYKAILLNSLYQIRNNGFCGLVHPPTVYEDTKGYSFRELLFQRLKYLFQFRNELNLFPIGHTRQFCISIYDKNPTNNVDFQCIFNLYHPSTIYDSYNFGKYNDSIPGLKKFDPTKNRFTWDLRGHNKRIINITNRELKLLSQIDNKTHAKSPRLISLHGIEDIDVLRKIFEVNDRISHLSDYFITEGWHETNYVKKGLIIDNAKETKEFVNFDHYIFVGPQVHICNPFYRTPRKKVKNHHDYLNIYLNSDLNIIAPRQRFSVTEKGRKSIRNEWVLNYKIAFNKMLDSGVERTLQPCILPKLSTHTGSLISISSSDSSSLLILCGLASSILFDFYIKAAKKANVSSGLIENFPMLINKDVSRVESLKLLVARLNFHHISFKEYWTKIYNPQHSHKWSNDYANSLDNNASKLSKDFSEDFSIKSYYLRRMALIEIDVIISQLLKVTLSELVSIYLTYFPITMQYDNDTYYDLKGEIVYTSNSQGLKGVGVPIEIFEKYKNLNHGESFQFELFNHEIYGNRSLTFYAPFKKYDRIEDYQTAWEHFEKVFSEPKE